MYHLCITEDPSITNTLPMLLHMVYMSNSRHNTFCTPPENVPGDAPNEHQPFLGLSTLATGIPVLVAATVCMPGLANPPNLMVSNTSL